MMEVWKDIPSLPGYQASSFGRISAPARLRIDCRGRHLRWPARIYQGCKEANGRAKVYVGYGKYRKVAALVCEAFHGPRPSPKHECLHLDEDCTNDRPENVAWGTKHQNQSAPGLAHSRSLRYRGERHPNAKLTDADVAAIRAERGIATSHELAERYGISLNYVGQLWRGESRTREASR